MRQKNITSKNTKKERIKINNINDFKNALKREGCNINKLDGENFKEEITKIFDLDKSVTEKLLTCIKDSEVTYRANDTRDFVDYIEKMVLLEDKHIELCKKINEVKTLHIDRVEYEREPRFQENVEDILIAIEKIKINVCRTISEKEKINLEKLEKELDEDYLYAKDIELLKKIILTRKEMVKEKYNNETKIKTISIEIPKQINHQYLTSKKGSVEYHEHLNSNIPRMQRLIKNMNKYMKVHEKEKSIFKINQSNALQDSINIAVAVYDNKEFKAISGSNNIKNYCTSPPKDEAIFKSSKVNKLGKLGIGYDRVNDSEKKIFEEIHKQIKAKVLKNEGNLILYSKWEPCPSCYFVISQFCEKHPNIKVQVKYCKRYGE
ncbi:MULTISPECIES: deaminase domain-containing protein [unclassified Clostridium]|uniref:deaminase domain-containing protein n=1 Tax=unclassified Clostridium TaxID=2614128 RepID=UPI000297CE18|nr:MULTISPECIES: deaminase domain-containing protein [unclassified Clostridium]EKQ50212.1 MAG: APOBEC-like N-terminal domain containing protein [Clostridium sp. Maddingley MBC34-26]